MFLCGGSEYTEGPFPYGVPPVVSSTSAEYNLQEVKGCTMAQPAWHAAKSLQWSPSSRNVVELHQLLPKASEGGKVKRLREEIAKVFTGSGVHVYCLDKARVTENLYPLLPRPHWQALRYQKRSRTATSIGQAARCIPWS